MPSLRPWGSELRGRRAARGGTRALQAPPAAAPPLAGSLRDGQVTRGPYGRRGMGKMGQQPICGGGKRTEVRGANGLQSLFSHVGWTAPLA